MTPRATPDERRAVHSAPRSPIPTASPLAAVVRRDSGAGPVRAPRGETRLKPAADAQPLLTSQRDEAERLLNAVRLTVLLLLATAALAYAPSLTRRLNLANVLVLVPSLLWSASQYLLFYRRPLLPPWLALANPVLDVTGVTLILGAYALAGSAPLALRTPIFLAYFVILAGRPIASSVRTARTVAALVVVQYAALLSVLVAFGRVPIVRSPVDAVSVHAVSPLDEGAKLLFLVLAGVLASYATAWSERLVTSYDRAARERGELEVRLATARLQSLKLQLRPHFLFNALNTITALIGVDPRRAERMVTGLAELLRLSLSTSDEQEVPLERELQILEHYLDIERVRFQDRLQVAVRVSPETRRALVPNLILQPLVENAIRHGIAPRAAGGRVAVEVSSANDMLRILVTDDGVGAGPDAARREGVGLGNTRARLRHLYAERHRFVPHAGERGGFVVELEIPFRVAASGTEAESAAGPELPRGE